MALQQEVASFILASATKLKIPGNEHRVTIPILVNTSIIKKGDELVYYAPKAEVEKRDKEVRCLQIRAPVAKKPKVSTPGK